MTPGPTGDTSTELVLEHAADLAFTQTPPSG